MYTLRVLGNYSRKWEHAPLVRYKFFYDFYIFVVVIHIYIYVLIKCSVRCILFIIINNFLRTGQYWSNVFPSLKLKLM